MTHWRRRVRQRRLGVELATRVREESAGARLDEPGAAVAPLPFDLIPDGRGATAAEETAPEVHPTPPSPPSGQDAALAPAEPGGASQAEQDLLLRAAVVAVERGDYRRGEAICREVLTLNPGHGGARRQLATALDRCGDVDRALVELNSCLARDGRDASARIGRAALLGRRGRYLEAEQDLRAVLERDPASAEAYHQLGVVLARKGLWIEALPHLRRAIELDAGRAEAHVSLAEAFNHVDDLPGALQAYQRAVELRPHHARALYGLGIVLDRMNRPAEAALMYRRSREIGTT